MKRNIYLLGIMLFIGVTGYAQEWLATTNLPGEITNTIIRQYKEDQSISYIQTTRGCFFAWSDNQTVINLVGIDCGYEVKDFEIYRDTVCFCGKDGTKGFVGWFRIPGLMSGFDAFHIFNSFNTHEPILPPPTPPLPPYTPSFVACFNDLTIFEDVEDSLHRVHIALVGETNNNVSCVAELKGFFNSSTWTYTTGATVSYAGTLDHVIATSLYIVAAGITNDEVCISLRVFAKTSMLTSLLGDVIHKYPWYNPTQCIYPVRSFQMTAMDYDLFATTSLYRDTAAHPFADGFVTHVFDATATAYSPIGIPCVDNRLVKVSNGATNRGVNSLTFSRTQNVLAGLVRSNNSILGNSSHFGELLWPFTFSTDYFVNNGYLFYNHDKFFYETGYLAMGRNVALPNELAILARHLLTTSNPLCGIGRGENTKTGNFAMKNDDFPLTLYSQSFEFDKLLPLGYDSLYLNIICR